MSRRMPGLHAETFGCGPELVMVHGWAMHSGVWRDFAEGLADRVRVTLIDLPGHGRSGSVDGFALEYIAAKLAEAAPHKAHWLGWSLGALLVLKVAERYPEQVNGVILMAGSPRFIAGPGWPGVESALLEQIGRNLDADYTATVRRFIGLQTFGMNQARVLARQIEARLDECDPPEPEALRGGLDILRGADLRDTLRSLTGPSLAVLGMRDRLVPAEVGPALQALTPRVKVQVLDAAAHLPFLTHPDETTACILDYIRRR